MVTFQPESHVASCKTLGGAQKLVEYLTENFTGKPEYCQHVTFCSVIETSRKVSVHASIPLNETGHILLKEAVSQFKAQYTIAA